MSVWTNLALSGTHGYAVGSWTGGYSQLIDGSDATFLTKTSAGSGDLRQYPVVDVAVPANEVIDGIRWRCRMSRPSFATTVSVALFGVGELNPRSGAASQSFVGFTSITTVTGPWLTVNETGYTDPFTGIRTSVPLSQADVNAAQIRVTDGTATVNVAKFYELGLDLATASIPTVAITTPSGTVVDNLAPSIAWTYADLTQATVSNKALTSNVATITTSAAHGFLVGNDVTVAIGDAVFDGVYKITAVTSTTFSYARTNTNVSSVSASGTATIGDAAPQDRFEVKVFTAAQYGAAGFDPSTSTPYWTTQGGSATSVTPGVLPNATTFRAYVRVGKRSTAGQILISAWTYSTFTTSATPPPPPVVTATYDAPNGRVALVVRNGGNKLTADDASAETTVGTWAALSNMGTPTRSNTVASHGSWSVRMSSTAAGTMTMRTASGLSGYEVEEAQPYTAMAQLRAGASARTCRVGVQYYDAAGATLGSIDYGSPVTTSTSAWTAASVASTSPTGAAFAAVVIEVQSTGGAAELHYADAIGLAPGGPVSWSPGGRTFTVELTRTQGSTVTVVRGAAALVPDAAGLVTLFDYEAAREVSTTYTATVTATAASAAVTSNSAPSSPLTATSDGTWWLKAVADPTLNQGGVPVIGTPQVSHEENLGTFRLDGRPDAVVVAGQTFGDDPDYTILARGAAQIAAVRALVVHQGTLLVQEPWEDSDGVGKQRWFRVTSRSWTEEGTAAEPRTTFAVRGVEVGKGY